MPKDLAADHLESLYLTDGNGRLTRVNQWDGGSVPRFHLCRSPHGNHWRFCADLDSDLVERLEALCRREPVTDDLRPDPRLARACLRLLGEAAPVVSVWRGPTYAFPEPFDAAMSTDVLPITPANADLLETCLPDWRPDVPHRQPFYATLVDGVAVAVCASVRLHPRVHEAGVESHPDHRRRGHARRAVAAWGTAVRRAGAEPLYSTSWENTASQGVALSLGLGFIAADFHVT